MKEESAIDQEYYRYEELKEHYKSACFDELKGILKESRTPIAHQLAAWLGARQNLAHFETVTRDELKYVNDNIMQLLALK